MKILLIGVNGQVGYELQRSLICLAQVKAATRDELDLNDDMAIRTCIQAYRPDLIVNAAAYTAVDKAEIEQELAMQLNAQAPKIMAEEAVKLDIPLIHYSTDYVFNGQNSHPWQENDATDPINFYGKTKLLGEEAIAETGVAHLIFRTSWVYGLRGNNFLLTMKRLASERKELFVVDDQIGTPTWSRHIADITGQIIAQSKSASNAKTFFREHTGIYNLTGKGQTSWYGFAKAIFEDLSRQGEVVPTLHAITSDKYPTPAKRPFYSCLNNDKLAKHFGVMAPDWKETLALVMKQ
jgi:dTDP-4-dehydrorhamnose reductase